MIIHTVTPGDSIYSISKQYGVPESRIITENLLDPTKKLIIGQALLISRPCKTCAVRGGDTLNSIAEKNSVSVLSLLQNNPQVTPDRLKPSQTLNISYDKDKAKQIIVSAYTGTASQGQIEKYLPYISLLHIQNAAHIRNGEVTLLQNVSPLISAANKYRALPILTIECTDERGRWNGECVSEILASPDLTERFIQSIVAVAQNNGFAGAEVQVCCQNDASQYKLFDMLLALSGLLKENDLLFSIPLIPEIANDETMTQFSDIGEILPLWSYIWDDTNTASPAAPLHKTREALNNTILVPHRSKILLGIPTFGVTYTKTPSGHNKQIIQALDGLQITNNSPLSAEFDETTRTPFIRHNERIRGDENDRIIHYEDARSYAEKLDLVDAYDLGGVNVMSLAYEAPVFWQILNQRYNIAKY